MLNDQELEALLREIESDRVERKAAFTDKDRICEAICAFANDLADHRAPGVVFIGVNDDGSSAGLAVDDELLKKIAALRADGNILPLPDITVQKRVLAGVEVACIEVEPSPAPPVRFRGRTYIRVGPTRAIATREQEMRLAEKRRALDLPFDHQPVPGATIHDLDLTLFERVYLPSAVAPEILAANDRSVEQLLAAVRFLAANGAPTVAGMLAVGKVPRDWIPGAYIQFLRLEGPLLTDPIRHQAELMGPLPDLLAELDRHLEANVSIATEVAAPPTEVRLPDYPIAALKQLTRNAVMHRNYETSFAPIQIYWYADRIEISNPGGPFGRVTAANFGQPGLTDYRNPLLAEAMKTMGYVQRFGMGLPLAQSELRRNGNPDWEYQGAAESTLLILRKRP